MNFEFDPNKSRINFEKHGIDFIQAQLLWEDFNLISLNAKTIDESRTIFIGNIDINYWTAVATMRKENIRLISVRKARKNEIILYEISKNN